MKDTRNISNNYFRDIVVIAVINNISRSSMKNKIDSLIFVKQRKIEKLQEYKKSLIYEYVTGKKEVMA